MAPMAAVAVAPAAFDEDAYRAELLRKMRSSQLVVHHAVFAPAAVSRDPVLLAATSTGLVHVFQLADVLVLGTAST
jgi:hypothetical protein